MNGTPCRTAASTLSALLAERGFGPKVATARNGDFVPASLREATPIGEGDRIEVLAAMQGG
nr:sulfur carrier protein ThiS [Paracoccus sp. S1E-3]